MLHVHVSWSRERQNGSVILWKTGGVVLRQESKYLEEEEEEEEKGRKNNAVRNVEIEERYHRYLLST
jgi:hypothetical protein